MKFKTFMTVYAVISAVFGIGFILAPGLLLPIYGFEVGASINVIARLFGAALISLAIVAWSIRGVEESESRRAITLALFVGELAGLVVAFIGQLGGVMNALGWVVVAIYLLMTAGLGYFQFSKQ